MNNNQNIQNDGESWHPPMKPGIFFGERDLIIETSKVSQRLVGIATKKRVCQKGAEEVVKVSWKREI
jgi:hypothetical protein